MEEEFASG